MKFDLRYLVEDVDRYGKARIYLRKPGCTKWPRPRAGTAMHAAAGISHRRGRTGASLWRLQIETAKREADIRERHRFVLDPPFPPG